MLLLFDVGNTAATYGICHKNKISNSKSIIYNDIPKLLMKCYRSGDDNYNKIIISSVVPKITQLIANAGKALGYTILIAGRDFKIPVKHRYPRTSAPGIDRILNVYGALAMYSPPALVIDFGTAITFDYVSPKGIFEGGMIIPGPELSFQSLIQRAALLPKKARLPKKAKSFMGTNTLDCLESGILHGYGAMTEGLIQRFKSRYGKDLKVIATGGFSKHLAQYSKGFDVIDPRHSIKSLLHLAQTLV